MSAINSNIHLVEDCTDETFCEKIKYNLSKVKCLLSVITVEPCLAVYMMSISISSLAVQNLNLEKACRVNLKYSDEVCTNIMNQNTTHLEEQVREVQRLVAKVVAWKFPLQTTIPALLVLFIGAWSDRTRRRKILIIFPMIGEIVSNIGLIMATYYFVVLPLELTAVIEAIPPALTGGWIVMFLGMYSYMSDITSEEDRTFRLGFVTICVTLGTPAGTALSGILTDNLGFYGVFTLLIFLHLSAFTYGILRLNDIPLPIEECNNNVDSDSWFKRFFLSKAVFDTIKVVFKRSDTRIQVICIMILNFIMVGPLYGDSQVGYLYARYKFNISVVEYSLYTTYNILIGILGTLIVTMILTRLLNIQDSVIGILAGVSRIAGCFVLTFAPNKTWYYAAPVFNIFSSAGLTAVRSTASKIVPNNEIAQLSSILGVCEALAPSLYMPTSSRIYTATMETLPGAFYMFDASLTIVALILFGWLYCESISHSRAAEVKNEKQIIPNYGTVNYGYQDEKY